MNEFSTFLGIRGSLVHGIHILRVECSGEVVLVSIIILIIIIIRVILVVLVILVTLVILIILAILILLLHTGVHCTVGTVVMEDRFTGSAATGAAADC